MTAQGKFYNEDGIVRRLKEGKILVRFYTYGSMFEEWLDPADVRKLSGEEILRGLSGPSQPVTQRDFDGPQDNQRYRGRGANQYGDFRQSFRGPAQRNRRQDRMADRYRTNRYSNDNERRRDEKNWNWYQNQRDRRRHVTASDNEWQIRAAGGNYREPAWGDEDAQWGRKSQRQIRREQRRQPYFQQKNLRENQQAEAAISGKNDWSAFVSPVSETSTTDSSSGDDASDDFFSSLMSDLTKDLDSDNTSRQRQGGAGLSSDSSSGDSLSGGDDFFASLMSELSQDDSETKSGMAAVSKKASDDDDGDFFGAWGGDDDGDDAKPASTKQEDDDFFASLGAELGSALLEDAPTAARATPASEGQFDEDNFFVQLGADLSPTTEIAQNKPMEKVGSGPASTRQRVEDAQKSGSGSKFSADELGKYTVTVLKDMLRERGMKVSGRKAELVERLMEAS